MIFLFVIFYISAYFLLMQQFIHRFTGQLFVGMTLLLVICILKIEIMGKFRVIFLGICFRSARFVRFSRSGVYLVTSFSRFLRIIVCQQTSRKQTVSPH